MSLRTSQAKSTEHRQMRGTQDDLRSAHTRTNADILGDRRHPLGPERQRGPAIRLAVLGPAA